MMRHKDETRRGRFSLTLTTRSAAERIRLTADLCTERSANAAAFSDLIKFANDRCELCKRELVCFVSCWLQTGRAAKREGEE